MAPSAQELLNEELEAADDYFDKVAVLVNHGWTVREIAEWAGLPKSNVGRQVKKICEERGIELKTKRGPPPMLDDYDTKCLFRLVLNGSFKTWGQVAAQMNEVHGVCVSLTTIRRYCVQLGISSMAMLRSPPLTKGARKARLAFCKRHARKGGDEWDNWIWSDESAFRLYRIDGKQRTIRPKAIAPRPQDFQIKAHTGGGKVVVWGCISGAGTGVLLRVEGNMNAGQYCSRVLDWALPESLKKMGLDEDGIVFMQDNAGPHKARQVMQRLEEADFETVAWPPYSPDLNPIENLWENMKRRVMGSGQAQNLDELWAKIKDVWEGYTVEEIRNFTRSMPKRMKACIQINGGPTKY
jgi:hypothetical protein